MTKEFDAKNAEKSRRVCAAMEEVANSMRRCGELRHDCDITAKSTAKSDNVSHPSHYTSGGIEAKDALKAAMNGSELSPMASTGGAAPSSTCGAGPARTGPRTCASAGSASIF